MFLLNINVEPRASVEVRLLEDEQREKKHIKMWIVDHRKKGEHWGNVK